MLKLVPGTLFLLVTLSLIACGEKGHEDDGHDHDAAGGHAHWGYEGDGAPEKWGSLDPAYAACEQGTKQSPIDIRGASDGPVPKLEFDYKPSRIAILNNGHAIQVNYDPGSTLKVDGEAYELAQFHFHTPSEHTVNGNAYQLEMHLVHKNAKGELAVVGVLIERGEGCPSLKDVWANLPLKKQAPKIVDGATVNILDALPADRSLYTYAGSLTTPPCTEGVHWFVLTTPITMSPEQVAAFQKAFTGNARPVQPLGDRTITTGK